MPVSFDRIDDIFDKYVLLIVIFYALVLTVAIDWGSPTSIDPTVRYYLLSGNFEYIIHNVRLWELSPPGWHILAWFIIRFPVSPPTSFRIINLLLVLGTIPIAYFGVAKAHSRWPGYLTAAIIPANITILEMIYRADHYILFGVSGVVCCVVAMWATDSDSVSGGTDTQLGLYAIVVLISGMVHYYSMIVIASIGLIGLYVRWPDQKQIIRWIGAHIPLFLSYILWIPIFLEQYKWYSQRFGTETDYIPLGPAGSIFPINSPDPFIILIPFLIISFITIFVVLLSSIRTNEANVMLWFPIIFSVLSLILIDIIGSAGGRKAIQLAFLIPVGIGLGIGNLHTILTKSINKNKYSKILTLGVIFIILLPYASSVVLAISDPVSNPEGHQFQEAAADVDDIVAEDPEDTAVLSVLHVGEAVLRYYNQGEYEVYGIPVDAIKDHRMVVPIHTQQKYRTSNDTHEQRLNRIVEGNCRIVVFLAHGETLQRFQPLKNALYYKGYEITQEGGTRQAGFVVFEKINC